MDTGVTEAGAGDSSAADFRASTTDAPAVDSTLASQDPRTGSRTDADDSLVQILPHEAPGLIEDEGAPDPNTAPAGPEAGDSPAQPAGQDINSTAEQNAPVAPLETTPQDEAETNLNLEKLRSMAQVEKVSQYLGGAVVFVQARIDAGDFQTEDQRSAAASAIDYRVNPTPDNLKALIKALGIASRSGDAGVAQEAIGIYSFLSSNISVTYEGRSYSLRELKNSTDTSVIDGGVYERSTQEAIDLQLIVQKVDDEVAVLERTVVRLKGRPEAEVYQKQFDLLRLAQQAQGEAGGIVAVRALEMVIDPRNPKDPIRQLLNIHGEAVVRRSRQAIETQLRSANYSEVDVQSIWELARSGDWEGLAKAKDLQNSGLETTIFGKNAEKVVKDLMGPGMFEKYGKKYGKGGILAIALILVSGLMEFKNTLKG